MNYSLLIRMLQQHVTDDKRISSKHIIRFINRKEYHRFLRQFKAERPSLFKKAMVQQIRMINAVICTLASLPKSLNHKGISYIEEDTQIKVHGMGRIKAVATIGSHIPWNVSQISAPQAWTITTGRFIKIGVIDTGADYSHPSLRNSLARGINFVQRGFPPLDDNGHGTHISGTIAALSTHKGILGTAPGAVIHPVKAFDRNGAAFVSDIIQGIDWCVRNGMHLINMSFGMKQESKALHEAIRNAYDQGIILVASAGNDGAIGQIDFPARYPETIAVGATSKNRTLARFSNRGRKVQIYAPGNKIMSTWPGDRFMTLSGTSMSTSHIAGAIALLLSVRPGLSDKQVRSLLKKTSRPLRNVRRKTMREVDAYRLVRLGMKA